MKKTTSHMVATGVSALLATLSTAHADLTFAAPGMNKAQSVAGTQIQQSVSLGHYWRYEVNGYDWRLVAGKPVDGKIGTDGSLLTSNDTSFQGLSSLLASANGQALVSDAGLKAAHIDDRNGSSIQLGSPVILKDQVINLSFSEDTNMERDGGSYVALRGTAIKSPPVPSGDLSVASAVRVGATPDLDWIIRREGTTGTTPSVPDNVTTWSFQMEPGDSGSCVSNTESSTEAASSDAPNSDKNRTNNGHGNNADGVDSSNPGKSAQVWNDQKGIIDQSATDEDPTNDDDESTGGGAAPSQQ